MDITEEIKRIKAMPQEQFVSWINERRSNIWSFPDLYPPNSASYLGSILRDGTRYLYYMDAEGNMYYESDAVYAWKKRMQAFHIADIKKGDR